LLSGWLADFTDEFQPIGFLEKPDDFRPGLEQRVNHHTSHESNKRNNAASASRRDLSI
jgi:hypothetical protein